MVDEDTVYDQHLLKVVGLLEDIIIDEYLMLGLRDRGSIHQIYSDFLQRVKYSYRWFGIRSEGEFVEKWNDLRSEMVLSDSDFVDTSPSTQISLLTQITQRLMLVTVDETWDRGSWLITKIAKCVNVYDDTSENSDKDAAVMYDSQIMSTVSTQTIETILGDNPWLIVVILMSWVSNRSVLQALGHIQHDDEK